MCPRGQSSSNEESIYNIFYLPTNATTNNNTTNTSTQIDKLSAIYIIKKMIENIIIINQIFESLLKFINRIKYGVTFKKTPSNNKEQ